MPIQPNFMERVAFFRLNAAPAPMLDLAGALAFQVLSTAVHLNIFNALHERQSTLQELTQSLDCQERGLQKLLATLVALGYVAEKNGHYHNTPMTEKWFLDGATLDLYAAVTCWGTFLQELWPNALVQLVGFMYYLFADGRTFSRSEVELMLDETGFAHIQVNSSAKWSGTSLVTAVKGN